MTRKSQRSPLTNPDSRFSPEIVEELLERLRNGESMRAICADERMPSREVVRQWSEGDGELALAITRAREIGYFDRAEAAVEAAKAAEDAQKGRLAFDAERWFLGKLSKAFAEKVVVQGDPQAPLTHEHKIDMSGAPKEVLEWLAGQKVDGDPE